MGTAHIIQSFRVHAPSLPLVGLSAVGRRDADLSKAPLPALPCLPPPADALDPAVPAPAEAAGAVLPAAVVTVAGGAIGSPCGQRVRHALIASLRMWANTSCCSVSAGRVGREGEGEGGREARASKSAQYEGAAWGSHGEGGSSQRSVPTRVGPWEARRMARGKCNPSHISVFPFSISPASVAMAADRWRVPQKHRHAG